jgi:hypothetical protein
MPTSSSTIRRRYLTVLSPSCFGSEPPTRCVCVSLSNVWAIPASATAFSRCSVRRTPTEAETDRSSAERPLCAIRTRASLMLTRFHLSRVIPSSQPVDRANAYNCRAHTASIGTYRHTAHALSHCSMCKLQLGTADHRVRRWWRRVDTVVCVSQFVCAYVLQYAQQVIVSSQRSRHCRIVPDSAACVVVHTTVCVSRERACAGALRFTVCAVPCRAVPCRDGMCACARVPCERVRIGAAEGRRRGPRTAQCIRLLSPEVAANGCMRIHWNPTQV